ncbi:hypothetical protein POTOM_013030 [Populus tomentosa]|uniref:Uncharacterized protein n=1 Tax=Populus tomentosa TaxID=118781 RepID=A0A8X8A3Z4_POPTO|nr:hypothetical protein POTOM_013030 [Populus tomentosa]
MARASKEPCKKEACDIQACLSKNNFLPQNCSAKVSACVFSMKPSTDYAPPGLCLKVIENLQSCCVKCDYKSTHCASVSGLLKQMPK